MADPFESLFNRPTAPVGEKLEQHFPCECGRIANGYYDEQTKTLLIRCSEGHEARVRNYEL